MKKEILSKALAIILAVSFGIVGGEIATTLKTKAIVPLPTQLFYSSFEDPNPWEKWSVHSSNWESTGPKKDAPCDNSKAKVSLKGEGNRETLQSVAISTLGYYNISLTYKYKIEKDLEPGDDVKVEWSTDNTNWNFLQAYTGHKDDNWKDASFGPIIGAENQGTLYLRFTASFTKNDSHDDDEFWLDCVKVEGTQMTPTTTTTTTEPSTTTTTTTEPPTTTTTTEPPTTTTTTTEPPTTTTTTIVPPPPGGGAPITGTVIPTGGVVAGATTGGGVVAGATTVKCEPYLLSYIKLGGDNDPEEVKKLESFLNEFLGLDLPIDGIYDLNDFNAVKQFQLLMKDKVLAPWVEIGCLPNVNTPTGYVYKTTIWAINNLFCSEEKTELPKPDLSNEICHGYGLEGIVGQAPTGQGQVLGEEVAKEGETATTETPSETTPEETPPTTTEGETQVTTAKSQDWLWAILILAILGGAGYFLFFKKK
jgi:hypothetical protein